MTDQPSRVGRPPKDPEDRLSELLTFTATVEMKEELNKRAGGEGRTLSGYIRRVLELHLQDTEEG